MTAYITHHHVDAYLRLEHHLRSLGGRPGPRDGGDEDYPGCVRRWTMTTAHVRAIREGTLAGVEPRPRWCGRTTFLHQGMIWATTTNAGSSWWGQMQVSSRGGVATVGVAPVVVLMLRPISRGVPSTAVFRALRALPPDEVEVLMATADALGVEALADTFNAAHGRFTDFLRSLPAERA